MDKAVEIELDIQDGETKAYENLLSGIRLASCGTLSRHRTLSLDGGSKEGSLLWPTCSILFYLARLPWPLFLFHLLSLRFHRLFD